MKNLFVFLTLFLFSFNLVQAETDCPFGLVNDPAPGDCSLFIDKDGNNYCDHSEVPSTGGAQGGSETKEVLSEEDLKAMTVKEVADFFEIESSAYASEIAKFLKIEVGLNDSLQVLHDNHDLCAGVAAGIAQGLVNGEPIDANELESHDLISGKELKTKTVGEVARIYSVDLNDFKEAIAKYIGQTVYANDSFQSLHDLHDLSPSVVKDMATNLVAETGQKDNGATTTKTPAKYKFFQILFIVVALYIISFLSVKSKYITLLSHRRIWNLILLFAFLISAIFGIMLVLAINYGWFLGIYAFILYWHVEFGTIMAIITCFHIAWHIPYFTAIFKKRKPVVEQKKED